jgi:hypothetical protein
MVSLGAEPGDFNLLELPITRHYNQDHFRMFNQISHERPIIGGYLSRPVVDPYRFPDTPFAPIADFIIRTKRQPNDIITVATNQEDLDNLVSLYNFRYIVLYLQEFNNPPLLDGWLSLLSDHYGPQQKVYEDTDIVVFRVPDTYIQNRPHKVMLALGSGWYPAEQSNEEIWRWSQKQSLVYLTSVAAEKVEVTMELRSFYSAHNLQVKLNQQVVYETRVSEGLPVEVSFQVSLPAGRNELALISKEGDLSPAEIQKESTDSRRLAFSVHSIKVMPL